jgi:molybdenum cofactor cytidylyltransferase
MMSDLGVVILAAGASQRMGRPKLLLPWRDTSILGHLQLQWQKLDAAQIAVVLAGHDLALRQELDRLAWPCANRIVNPAPEQGMIGSIRCAAQWAGWKADLRRWAIVLGDQPHVQLATLREVVALSTAHPGAICQPARGGRARHPVLLPAAFFRQLADWPGQHLKQFLQTNPVMLREIDDAGLDLDIDQPADYERARQLLLETEQTEKSA